MSRQIRRRSFSPSIQLRVVQSGVANRTQRPQPFVKKSSGSVIIAISESLAARRGYTSPRLRRTGTAGRGAKLPAPPRKRGEICGALPYLANSSGDDHWIALELPMAQTASKLPAGAADDWTITQDW